MEDQEKIRPEEEQVEAHKKGHGQHPHASDSEPKQEGEDEGDFELHRRGGKNPH